MEDRPDSRGQSSAAENDSTTAVPSKASVPLKRPLTKPIAPRLSTVTKPPSLSAARTSTASSLNKPPTRPAVSSLRRPIPTATTPTGGSSNVEKPPISSGEGKTSGDEGRADSITAKPKRMSMAASTTLQRGSARSTTTTPARNSAAAAVTRPSALSSSRTAKPPATPTSRSVIGTSVPSRPLSSSTLRNANALPERKRLSTIPASPAVKTQGDDSAEDKENALSSVPESSPVQPTSSEADPVEMGSNTPEPASKVDEESEHLSMSESQVTDLQTQLDMSHAEVDSLRSQVDELITKMADFSRVAEEESSNVQSASETIRIDHTTQIEALVAAQKTKIEEMSSMQASEIETLVASNRSEINKLTKKRDEDMASKETALQGAKRELEQLRSGVKDEKARSTSADAAPPAHAQELADVQQKLQAALQRHQATKDTEKSEITKVQEEHTAKVEELQARHRDEVAVLNKQIDGAQADVSSKQTEIGDLREEHTKTMNSLDGEMNRQGQVIQTLRNEINAFQHSKNNESSRQNDLIKQLQDEIASLQSSKSADAAAAADTLSSLKSTSDEKIKAAELQLHGAQEDQEALRKVEAELIAARSELESMQAGHEKSLQALRSQADEQTKSNVSAQADHEEKLTTIASQLATVQEETDALKLTHAEQLESMESRFESSRVEADAGRSAHADEIKQLDAKLQANHNKEVTELKNLHADQIHQLELQSKSALTDLDGLETSHLQHVEQVKAETALQHEEVVRTVKQGHEEEMKLLKDQLSAAQNTILESEGAHKRATEALQIRLDASKEEALTSVRNEHDKHLQELELQSKSTSDTATMALKATHAEQIRQVESQSRSAQADLESARFQVATIKGILQSVEEEGKQAETAHAETLQKLESEVETSVIKLAQQSAMMAQLRTQHDQELVDTQKSIEDESRQKVDTLKAEHDLALKDLSNKMESQHAAAIAKIQLEHTQHAEVSKASAQTSMQDAIGKVKSEHTRTLSDLTTRAKSDNDAAIEESRAENLVALTRLKETMQDHHRKECGTLESQIADLKSRLAEGEKSTAKLQQQHTDETRSTIAKHESVLTRLQGDLEDARRLAKKPQNTAEVEELTGKLTDAQSMVADLKEQYSQALSDSAMSQETASRAEREHATALEEAKAEHERTTTELQAKLSTANQTLQQLRDAKNVDQVHQAEVANVESPHSHSKTTHGPSSTASSPRAGLESSKWANSEDKAPPASSSLEQQEPQPQHAAEHWNGSTPSLTDPSATKRRNVEGQLAGIQEQIRQLDEINDEFLQEHERMARTLSKVDDRSREQQKIGID